MDNMPSVALELTRAECLYLSDVLSFQASGPRQEGDGAGLLLKIGAAFLETAPEKPPVSIQVSGDELWMIREVAKSGVALGTEKVGLNLMAKVYQGLLSLYAQPELKSVIELLGESTTEEPERAKYQQRLEQFQRQERSRDPEAYRRQWMGTPPAADKAA